MKEWVRDHGLECSQSCFTMGSLSQGRKSNFAEIKAKAHNCRVMIAWLADVTRACGARDGHRGLARAAAFWALADFCYSSEVCRDWALSEELAKKLHTRGHEFLCSYKVLANLALARREKQYGWKPKLHYFEHMLDTILVERINPTYFWNFAEEDLIGTAIDVASRTHRWTVAERVLDRLFLKLALVFAGRGPAPVGPPPSRA